MQRRIAARGQGTHTHVRRRAESDDFCRQLIPFESQLKRTGQSSGTHRTTHRLSESMELSESAMSAPRAAASLMQRGLGQRRTIMEYWYRDREFCPEWLQLESALRLRLMGRWRVSVSKARGRRQLIGPEPSASHGQRLRARNLKARRLTLSVRGSRVGTSCRSGRTGPAAGELQRQLAPSPTNRPAVLEVASPLKRSISDGQTHGMFAFVA